MLLGFSTAGKSTILNQLKSKYGERIGTIDTDSEISADYDYHIFNIFLSLSKPDGCTKDALDFIERKEREILISLVDRCTKSSVPIVIASGPAIVARQPQWSHFLNEVEPVCYYLKLTPEEVFRGLRARRESPKFDEVRNCPMFGCWDLDVITTFHNDTYELFSEKDALEKIRSQMKSLTEKYEEFAQRNIFPARELESNESLRSEFYSSIAVDLRLT
jgi:shikimate kinase